MDKYSEHQLSIRVLVVHCHRSTLWRLQQLIDSNQPVMRAIGGATTLPETFACLESARPDVILFDLNVRNGNGFDAIPQVTARTKAKILVLASTQEEGLCEAAILMGVRGVVGKDADRENLLAAITKVHRGEVWLDRVAADRFLSNSRAESRISARLRQRFLSLRSKNGKSSLLPDSSLA